MADGSRDACEKVSLFFFEVREIREREIEM